MGNETYYFFQALGCNAAWFTNCIAATEAFSECWP